ncbi:MAG: hypothetical protein LAT84_06855 [Balneolia bacterium]|nr:hypothetical protein [Balneolia bacterium]
MSNSANKNDFRLWGASHILALGTIQRLSYNNRRYEDSQVDEDGATGTLISIPEFAARADAITLNMQAYRNILKRYEDADFDEIYTAAIVLMAQRISNELYTLHHDLLELPAEDIVSIIPAIDNQLKLWSPDESAGRTDSSGLPDTPEADSCIKEMQYICDQLANLSA